MTRVESLGEAVEGVAPSISRIDVAEAMREYSLFQLLVIIRDRLLGSYV
jgi:hypothetical protein